MNTPDSAVGFLSRQISAEVYVSSLGLITDTDRKEAVANYHKTLGLAGLYSMTLAVGLQDDPLCEETKEAYHHLKEAVLESTRMVTEAKTVWPKKDVPLLEPPNAEESMKLFETAKVEINRRLNRLSEIYGEHTKH